MYEALLIDLDNTLVDRQEALGRYLRGWLVARGVRERAGGLVDEALEVDDLGYTSRAEFNRWWCEQVAQRAGVELSPDEFWGEFVETFGAAFRPNAIVRRALEALRERFALALVSNGGGANQRRKLAAAELTDLFDEERVLISAEVGAWKPAPEIFEEALARVGVAPRHALFIGDDPARDIAGAQRVGMATCWVSHGRAFPAGVVEKPRHTITAFTALEEAAWLR